MFFPTSVYDLLGSKSFQYSSEQITQYKNGLQNLITSIDWIFILTLIILTVLVIVKLRGMNIKLLLNNAVISILGGAVFHIFGFFGISWIFVIIGGIFLITYKVK